MQIRGAPEQTIPDEEHLKRGHRIHHNVQPDNIRKPPNVPSPAVLASVSASVSPNVPSPAPDHGSRSNLTPVEITRKGHDLPTYVVEASGIFEHQGRL